jgi:CRISPR/Cas system-associated exonuclease Cas4 (RecB family)
MKGTLIDGCPDLITPIYEAIRKEIEPIPCRTNWASEAGHSCEKYLVLHRTRWKEMLLHEPEVQFIFDGGRMIEKLALNDLDKAGFAVTEQNRRFEWSAFQISGKVDCKIIKDRKAYPIEIKGLNMFDFDKLNTIDDFLQSTKTWIRKYPAQLSLYMLMDNKEQGCFYIKRIPGFKPKQIWVQLNYEYAEGILKKLERVNAYVKNNTVPEGVKDQKTCQYCSFLHICLPDMIGTEMEIIDEIELEEAITRTEELKPLVSEYKKLDKKWKSALKEKPKVIIGEYIIVGDWIEKKAFSVPASKYWKPKILVKPDKTVKQEGD